VGIGIFNLFCSCDVDLDPNLPVSRRTKNELCTSRFSKVILFTEDWLTDRRTDLPQCHWNYIPHRFASSQSTDNIFVVGSRILIICWIKLAWSGQTGHAHPLQTAGNAVDTVLCCVDTANKSPSRLSQYQMQVVQLLNGKRRITTFSTKNVWYNIWLYLSVKYCRFYTSTVYLVTFNVVVVVVADELRNTGSRQDTWCQTTSRFVHQLGI